MATYTATFTATDTHSTTAGELSYEIRDAASGGGNLLISGTCTAGAEHTTSTITDNGLSHGSNTRYIRIFDGADNLYETSFSVEYELYLSSSMPTGGSATVTLSGIAPYVWSEMSTGGGATVTLDGIVPFIWSEMPTGGSATATLDGVALVPYISSAMPTGGSATVTLNGIRYPILTTNPYSRPRPRAIDLITVAIYRPLGQYLNGTRAPLDVLDINPNVTALSWSSVLPGGWSSASVGIAHPSHDDRYREPPRRPWLPREMAYGPFYHVEIRRHGRVLFAGRMWSQQRSYGVVTGFSVRGYAMTATHDMYYRNSSDTVVSTGTLLRAMIAATAPHLVAAPDGELWQDPGTGHAYDEFNRMYLADVLDQVSAEGDSAGNIVDWMVYEDQMVQLKTRAVPQRADYLVPWSLVPDFIEDSSGLIGVASYERTSNGTPTASSEDFTNPDFASEHGFQRGHMLQLGELSINAADAMTRAYLELHRSPISAASIVVGPDNRLESPGGREVPREAVRAGQWVQIEGMETPLVIVSTDYDAFTDVVRIQAGEFVPDFALLLSTLEQDRRKRQRMIRPQGGRAR